MEKKPLLHHHLNHIAPKMREKELKMEKKPSLSSKKNRKDFLINLSDLSSKSTKQPSPTNMIIDPNDTSTGSKLFQLTIVDVIGPPLLLKHPSPPRLLNDIVLEDTSQKTIP